MDKETLDLCFNKPFKELIPLFRKGFDISQKISGKTTHFYIPSMAHYETSFYKAKGGSFPGISVTGKKCQLNCDHCKGTLLNTMISAPTPEALFKTCVEIKALGGDGCLISGGSLQNGEVPLADFVSVIKKVKQELNLKVVVHTGLVQPVVAQALADAKVDGAMLDVIGSDETIEDVYHLNSKVGSFEQSLRLLIQSGIPTVPHVVTGLHYGKLKGERQAIEIISRYKPAAVVIVALSPSEHTAMEHATPPSPLDIARVILAVRLLMPQTPILLGCAKPPGLHKIKTETLALKAGVNGIAYPSEQTCRRAKNLGFDIRFHEKCCSLLCQDLAAQLTTHQSEIFSKGIG